MKILSKTMYTKYYTARMNTHLRNILQEIEQLELDVKTKLVTMTLPWVGLDIPRRPCYTQLSVYTTSYPETLH